MYGAMRKGAIVINEIVGMNFHVIFWNYWNPFKFKTIVLRIFCQLFQRQQSPDYYFKWKKNLKKLSNLRSFNKFHIIIFFL